MAKDVHAALCRIVEEQGTIPASGAEDYIGVLKRIIAITVMSIEELFGSDCEKGENCTSLAQRVHWHECVTSKTGGIHFDLTRKNLRNSCATCATYPSFLGSRGTNLDNREGKHETVFPALVRCYECPLKTN